MRCIRCLSSSCTILFCRAAIWSAMLDIVVALSAP
jgi:hypothetical protein